MSAAPESVPDLTLGSRGAQLQGVVAGAQFSDKAGKRLESETSLRGLVALFKALRSSGGHLYIVGNGGSAGVASHAVTDFLNVAKLRAATLHDASLLTCMSNDYGYEVAFARMVSTMAAPKDILVAISSSGQSQNIRNAAIAMREAGGVTLTLSGFKPDNPLRLLGDYNVWLDSNDYGMVEIGHQFVLHNIADRLRLGQ